MRVFNSETWNESWTSTTALTYLRDLLDTLRSSGVVAEVGGKIVGFALGRAEQRDKNVQLYLSEMCVSAEYQGQGVGKELLGRLEAHLKAQGVSKVYLLTTRGSSAEAFYQACGFYTSEKMVMLGKYL